MLPCDNYSIISLTSTLDDLVGNLLCQSVDSVHEVSRRQERKTAGVHDAQAIHAEDLDLGVDNVHLVDTDLDAVFNLALAYPADSGGVPDGHGAVADHGEEFIVSGSVQARICLNAGLLEMGGESGGSEDLAHAAVPSNVDFLVGRVGEPVEVDGGLD